MKAPRKQIRPLPASGAPEQETTALSPGERVFFFLALGLIGIWGFGGSWNLPEKTRIRTIAAFESEKPAAQLPDLAPTGDPTLALRGEAVFQDYGCNACHSIDGEVKIGPSLLGIHASQQPMNDGGSVLVDDAYIRQSILEPQARIVEGYDDSMPSYEGLLTDADLDALGAYIRSLEK